MLDSLPLWLFPLPAYLEPGSAKFTQWYCVYPTACVLMCVCAADDSSERARLLPSCLKFRVISVYFVSSANSFTLHHRLLRNSAVGVITVVPMENLTRMDTGFLLDNKDLVAGLTLRLLRVAADEDSETARTRPATDVSHKRVRSRRVAASGSCLASFVDVRNEVLIWRAGRGWWWGFLLLLFSRRSLWSLASSACSPSLWGPWS